MNCRIALAVAATLVASEAHATLKIVDKQPYTCGSYLLYNSPWSTGYGTGLALRQAVNFLDITTIQTNCPSETVIQWYWPGVKPSNAGVYGFDFVSWGQYDGGTPEVPVKPRSIASLNMWSVVFSLDYASVGEWNQLTETFLRDTGGNKKIEIGFITHVPATTAAWIKADKQLGTYTDRWGRAWAVVQHVGPTGTFPYVTLSPPDNANRASGALDFLGAARWLQGKGLVSSAWMASGLAAGIEPITGNGTLYMHSLTVNFQ